MPPRLSTTAPRPGLAATKNNARPHNGASATTSAINSTSVSVIAIIRPLATDGAPRMLSILASTTSPYTYSASASASSTSSSGTPTTEATSKPASGNSASANASVVSRPSVSARPGSRRSVSPASATRPGQNAVYSRQNAVSSTA